MQPRIVLIAGLLALAACHRTDDGAEWLGTVQPIDPPAGPGSRFPNLAAGNGQPVVMSWLEPTAGDAFALRHSTWSEAGWSAARTVAADAHWFINWADFPSVVPVAANLWAAHWLQQQPGNVYSYDVRLAVSRDGGATWSAPISPHDDGTATEHGFVSVFRDGAGTLRAAWLDGRHTAGEHDHAAHGEAASGGAMTLRAAAIDPNGQRIGADSEIDARVCDCCQTDAALTADGPVVVYRDRGMDEVRNIQAVRLDGPAWSVPVPVHDDGWRIAGCPVNGPAIAALGNDVAVAWFTAPDVPRVRIAFSRDGGRGFGPPLEVASGSVGGRVDIVLLPDQRAIVSWLDEGAAGGRLMAQPFTSRGAAGAPVLVANGLTGRQSGFPQMVRAGQGLLFAWTVPGDPSSVQTAYAPLR